MNNTKINLELNINEFNPDNYEIRTETKNKEINLSLKKGLNIKFQRVITDKDGIKKETNEYVYKKRK